MHQPISMANRSRAIQRVRERLMRDSFPRAQMALIVALTGGFGLLASFVMLQFGINAMALRYPLALSLAYIFFLFLIWLWLRTNAQDYLDVPDISNLIPRPGQSAGAPDFKSGSGVDFASGQATGALDGYATGLNETTPSPLTGVGDPVGSVMGADELAIPVLAIALAIGIALASFYVVYIAPVFFAEVLVDWALSFALFRHLRSQDPRHWLSSTFRRTAMPFVVTAVFLMVVGAAMSAYAPGAKSIGQFLDYASAKRATR
jgi:hypothetical protein